MPRSTSPPLFSSYDDDRRRSLRGALSPTQGAWKRSYSREWKPTRSSSPLSQAWTPSRTKSPLYSSHDYSPTRPSGLSSSRPMSPLHARVLGRGRSPPPSLSRPLSPIRPSSPVGTSRYKPSITPLTSPYTLAMRDLESDKPGASRPSSPYRSTPSDRAPAYDFRGTSDLSPKNNSKTYLPFESESKSSKYGVPPENYYERTENSRTSYLGSTEYSALDKPSSSLYGDYGKDSFSSLNRREGRIAGAMTSSTDDYFPSRASLGEPSYGSRYGTGGPSRRSRYDYSESPERSSSGYGGYGGSSYGGSSRYGGSSGYGSSRYY